MGKSSTTTEKLLRAAESRKSVSGKSSFADEAFRSVEKELIRRAKRELARRRRPDVTIETSALVNEAFVRLMDCHAEWSSSAEFCNLASATIKNLLISAHRKAQSQRHGGGWTRISAELSVPGADYDVISIAEAIDALNEQSPRRASLVRMRFLLEMTEQEVAERLGWTRGKIQHEWKLARAWLWRYLSSDEDN